MSVHEGRRRLAAGTRVRVRVLFSGGLAPREMAFTLCLGGALGVMPLIWGTTVLCALLAARFRLNQAAMQAINYLCYPLQLALFIPFCRLGEQLFPWGPALSGAALDGALHGHLGASLHLLAWGLARALGAWLLTALPLALIANPMLRHMIRPSQ